MAKGIVNVLLAVVGQGDVMVAAEVVRIVQADSLKVELRIIVEDLPAVDETRADLLDWGREVGVDYTVQIPGMACPLLMMRRPRSEPSPCRMCLAASVLANPTRRRRRRHRDRPSMCPRGQRSRCRGTWSRSDPGSTYIRLAGQIIQATPRGEIAGLAGSGPVDKGWNLRVAREVARDVPAGLHNLDDPGAGLSCEHCGENAWNGSWGGDGAGVVVKQDILGAESGQVLYFGHKVQVPRLTSGMTPSS